MSDYKTVLIDLDGTLLDHFAAIHRSHGFTTAHFGLPQPSMAEVRRAIGGGLETAVARIFGEANAHLVPEAVAVYREYFAKNMLHGVALLPGARELVERLRAQRVTCAILTNKHGPTARTVLQHLGVAPLFQGVFGAMDTPWLKPEREFTEHALRTLGATPDTACLLGDSPYDIETGRTAGFPCFCVTTGTHTREELLEAGADGVYDDMIELGRGVFNLDVA